MHIFFSKSEIKGKPGFDFSNMRAQFFCLTKADFPKFLHWIVQLKSTWITFLLKLTYHATTYRPPWLSMKLSSTCFGISLGRSIQETCLRLCRQAAGSRAGIHQGLELDLRCFSEGIPEGNLVLKIGHFAVSTNYVTTLTRYLIRSELDVTLKLFLILTSLKWPKTEPSWN